jgi:peptidoglycan/xylan/chitin deacetylase (PgdA/CDA1 family)/glycosyltransferase involved in cell wall biosynthesis
MNSTASGPQSETVRRRRRRIERPPAHWVLLVLFIAALMFLLLVEGLTAHSTGASGTPPPGQKQVVSGARAVFRVQDGKLVGVGGPPGRRIALTFDDGPDPTWTPRIAATLRQLDVPATFFVVGDEVVRHPDVVGDLHRDGFELGNHTFSHTNLVGIPSWRRDTQLSLTESAIAGAAGVRPLLLRPPYSATPDAVGPNEERAFADIAGDGYLIALSDLDAEDWRRPGVDQIVANVTPAGDRGGIVLMHDGGGDRSQTVTALEHLVPELRARGFKFVGLSEMLGIPRSELEPKASSGQHLRGELLIGALSVSVFVTDLLAALLIPIAVLAVLRAIVAVVLSRRHARRFRELPRPRSFHPPVSILVPAFNEAKGIEPAVRSLAGSDYPQFEVIVVDDGSSDDTAEIVEGLGLSNVRVLREENRGKAEALNTGLAAARHDLIVAVDADTQFEPQTVRNLVMPFAAEEVGAVAGNTKVGNRGGLLGRWQHIDYVMGFNLDRRLYDSLDCMPTVPGAIGAFRREALEPAGGFSSDTLAEDTDITIALGRDGWRVVYVEDARGYTEVPDTLAGLWRQRYRWSFGTMQSAWKHRRAIFRREGGGVGRLGLPYLIGFQILLPLLAPLIDVFALYGLLFLNPVPVIAYWVGFNLLMLGIAAYAFHLDHESPRPLWALPLQQFAYRQLMYLVVIQSVASAFQGIRLRWGHIERSGDVEVAPD